MLGWQWNNHPRLTKALKMNTTQGHEPGWGEDKVIFNNSGKEIDFIWQVAGWYPNPLYNSRSFTYKPTINPDNFSPISSDTEHNIWGFRTRNITNPVVVNNRLQLVPSDVRDSAVLSNPWRCNNFYNTLANNSGDHGEDLTPYNGKYWNVTLNLRRKDFTQANDTSDNAPVLVIKMPYYMTAGSDTTGGMLKFNSMPIYNWRSEMNYSYSVIDTAGHDTTHYQVSRGYQLFMAPITPVDSIVITRNMLPNSTDSIADIGPDITITFSFIADQILGHGNNPFFKTKAEDNTINRIDSIGLDVYYRGNCGILLNYIRIGNPLSDMLWKGDYDVIYQNRIQEGINIIKDKNYKLFRFYGRDEISIHYDLWDAMRYFNKLVGGLAITEGNSPDPRYIYRTETPNNWMGSLASGETAVPHFRINGNIPDYKDGGLIDSIVLKRIGFLAGFAMKYWPEDVPADTMNSDYETEFYNGDPNRWHKLRYEILDSAVFIKDTITTYRGLDYLFYATNFANQGKSWQWLAESHNYPFYTDDRMKKMLYNGQNWYQNLFLFGEFTLEARQISTSGSWDEKFLFSPRVKSNSRPFTGEEARWALWRSILFGSKGIAYDGHISPTRGLIKNDTAKGDNIIVNGIIFDSTALGNGASDEEIIYKDDLWGGLDFIPAKDSATNLTHTPIDTVVRISDDPPVDSTYLLGYYHSVNRDTTAKYLGCDTNRIYYGRKSPKTEMYKMHTWINANDSLLMDLRLVGTISKGIRFWQDWDPKYASNPLTKYLKYDSLHIIYEDPNNPANKTTIPSEFIKTRPIGRELNGEPYYEPWDSSFFDLAWHRPSKDTLLTGNIGYLIIQNRRVDPLFLYTPDTTQPERQYMKFLSTAEFDVLCDKGGKDPEFPGDSLPPEHWRSYFNKKLGMREISIPFAVIDSTKDIYYRVEELTDGSEFADNLPWWKQEEIRNRINVTLPQGQSLVANYLPGLGRAYKVTIVYDTTSPIIGELAFSNQTKMIAYPAGNYPIGQSSNYDFWKDSTTEELNFYKDSMMYYHIVYDRKMPESEFSRVYYRRSTVPYNREHSTKIIKWGPELLISDTLLYTKYYHLPRTLIPPDTVRLAQAGVNTSCRYPSIVVRYNEAASKAYTYIVFSCLTPVLPDTPRVFLVECAFPHDVILQNQIPDTLRPFAYGLILGNSLSDLEKFGNVSINASFSGNYYAWCESLYGIGVGWKAPNDRGFITNKKYIKFDQYGLCNQPSLNTYSRMEIKEDNCALVFREESISTTNIIYTRLHNPGGSIDNYVPKIFGDTSSGYQREGYYSLDSSTVLLNTWFGQYAYNAEFPAVYRSVEFAIRPGYKEADSLHYVGAVWDRVYWQGTLGLLTTSPKSIYMKNVDIDDTQARWWLLPPLKLYSPSDNLANASPGPGAPSSKTDGYFHEFALTDSSFLLNFVQYPLLDTLDYNADVFQINHHGWFNSIERWINGTPDDSVFVSQSINSLGKGKYPHTTHTPVITKHDDWYIHSRIFQTTDENIITRSKLFLKGQTDEKTIYPMLSLSDSIKNAQMSEIFMVDNQKSIGLKAFDSPEPGRIKAVDTIFSDWFRVDEIKELGFYSIVGDTSLYRMELESSKGQIEIPVRKDYTKFLTSRKITLLNGKNNLYRIKLIKRNKDIKVWVDLLFDTKRDLADMSNDTRDLNKSASQENSNHQIIDLGSGGLSADMDLRIFPNPASEFIYATGELLGSENQVIVYSLYNAAGLEVFKSEGISGQPIMIPTSDLTTGAYFLKAEQKFVDDFEIKHIISKSVIIQR